ncbi:MAG: outer membrane protein [Polaribacter sp.]|jgi:outer membrane protein TolC
MWLVKRGAFAEKKLMTITYLKILLKMKTKYTKSILPCFFVLLALIGTLKAQEQMSLEEAIKYARQNSLTIKNAKLNQSDADQLINERKATGLPQVNGKIDYQYYFLLPQILLPEAFELLAKDPVTGELPPGWSRQASFALRNNLNFGLSASSLIFDGSYLSAVKAAKRYRDYVDLELNAKEKEISDAVREAYLPPLLLSEGINILNKNITNIEKLERETAAMYKEGFVEQLDVDRLTLSLANLNTEKENLEKQREAAVNYLKFAINYPVDKELLLTDDINSLLVEATEEDLNGTANYNSWPQYKVAEMGLELNKLNIEVSKKGYLPSASAFASYSYGFQGDKFNDEGFWLSAGIVGLQIDVPIFDGFSKRSKIQRASLALEIARNQKKDLERVINLELTNSRTAYNNAISRVGSQQKNVDLAQRIYDMTQIKYKEGVGSSLEITQAEQSLFQTQQNYTNALYELLVAKAALDKALGK